MIIPETTVSFEVHTEVTPAQANDLLMFIHQNYVSFFYKHFTDVRQWSLDDGQVLAFTFLDSEGKWRVNVEVEAGSLIKIRMTPSGPPVPKSVLERIKEDLIINVQLFEEKIRRTTLYFAFVRDKKIMLERAPMKRKKALSQIFFGNMIVLLMIFIFISYMAFLAFGASYTPAILVASQLIIILFADKIMKRMGDWSITPGSPDVHILQCHIPQEEFPDFNQRHNRDQLLQIKREIYEKTLAVGKPIDLQTTQEVFAYYGITCKPENFSTKTLNVYRLVEKAAERFNIPMPKIIIANIIVPNAGTTGPSPSRGLILITTGLLVQLEEDEVFNVIGHEISHLKSRDPLALFALASAEYLFRAYVLLPYILYFGVFYVFLAFSGIYFIAKFFEARADLEAAIVLGNPEILAGALRKIGYKKIQVERLRHSRIGNWLGMDPHPPISFRITRLENLGDTSQIKHPFIKSISDCINGLIKNL